MCSYRAVAKARVIAGTTQSPRVFSARSSLNFVGNHVNSRDSQPVHEIEARSVQSWSSDLAPIFSSPSSAAMYGLTSGWPAGKYCVEQAPLAVAGTTAPPVPTGAGSDGRTVHMERLAQYIVRNPFSIAKMQANPSGDSILYRSGMNPKIKRNFQVFRCRTMTAIHRSGRCAKRDMKNRRCCRMEPFRSLPLREHRRGQGSRRKPLHSEGEGRQCATMSPDIRIAAPHCYTYRTELPLHSGFVGRPPATLEKRIPINSNPSFSCTSARRGMADLGYQRSP